MVLDIDKIADEPDATNNNESGCVGVGIEDAEKRVDEREVKRGGVEDIGETVENRRETEGRGGGEEEAMGAEEGGGGGFGGSGCVGFQRCWELASGRGWGLDRDRDRDRGRPRCWATVLDLAIFCRSTFRRRFGSGGRQNPAASGAEEVVVF
jgi:hypothetical protein